MLYIVLATKYNPKDKAEYKVWKQWHDYYNDCDNGKI
jgi:hypothetical protein